MEDKELKKIVKHIFIAYERGGVTAKKIDRCFGGANDIMKPMLDELRLSLLTEQIAPYTLTCLLNDVKSGDITVKEATNTYLDLLKG